MLKQYKKNIWLKLNKNVSYNLLFLLLINIIKIFGQENYQTSANSESLLSKWTSIKIKDVQNLIKEYARDFSLEKNIKLNLSYDQLKFACLSPCGKFIATLSESDIPFKYSDENNNMRESNWSHGINLYMWDANTGKYLYRLGNVTTEINSIAFSPCSKFLAASFKGSILYFRSHAPYICIYDLNSFFKTFIKKYNGKFDPKGYEGVGIDKIVYSSNGQFIAFTEDRERKIWDINTVDTVIDIKGNDNAENGYTKLYSADGKFLVSLYNLDQTIKICDITNKFICILPSNTSSVTYSRFNSPYNKYIKNIANEEIPNKTLKAYIFAILTAHSFGFHIYPHYLGIVRILTSPLDIEESDFSDDSYKNHNQ